MEKQYTLFLDQIARPILGVVISEDDTTLVVENPVVIQTTQNQQNNVKLQLIPFIFREVQADQDENVRWTFIKSAITRANISALTDRFIQQYEFVVGLTPEKAKELTAQKPVNVPTPVSTVKLFDSEVT